MPATGIDTYHEDGHPIDWQAVLDEGISFAIVKASEGEGTDPAFAADWKSLGEVGLTRGAYHLLRPSQQSSAQAKLFLSTLNANGGLLPADLPVSVDVELSDGTSRSHVIACTRNFINAIEDATQSKPLLYVSPGFAEIYLDDSFGDCPLWVAHYTDAAAPIVPAGWNAWTFWQWAAGEGGPGTEVGGPVPMHPPGCPKPVDSNRFNGTQEEMFALFSLGG